MKNYEFFPDLSDESKRMITKYMQTYRITKLEEKKLFELLNHYEWIRAKQLYMEEFWPPNNPMTLPHYFRKKR